MCGIFGVIIGNGSNYTRLKAEETMDQLFKLSESRGKEASGVALGTEDAIYVAKYAVPASEMIKRKEYREIFNIAFQSNNDRRNLKKSSSNYPMCFMGHSRLVTNGGQQIHNNNQPAIAKGMVAIHNGIVTNVDELWDKYPEFERTTGLDTEVLLHLIRYYYHKEDSVISGVQECFSLLEGVASLAIYFEDLNHVLLATNNGSLYIASKKEKNSYVFASEKFILKTLLNHSRLGEAAQGYKIKQVEPGTGILINLEDLYPHKFLVFSTNSNGHISENRRSSAKKIFDISPECEIDAKPTKIPGDGPYVLSPKFIDEYPKNKKAISRLQRCTKCILPETMPFIQFDDQGVCNYCHNYKPIEFKGEEALEKVLAQYRNLNGKPDCLVTFSGGRDSSYSVHLMKTEYNMNPVTFTYDWGMVTDLARRNQMRICGKLGLEHILVSADITKKRNNIRKNILAWLKDTDLGTVPIFMAGDKQYFYYMNKVSRQTGTDVIILGENLLETTHFKYGFCGLPPNYHGEHNYSLSLMNKFKLAWYYASNYITNLAYLNSSIIDTIGAYASYYIIPHDYINIYEYIKWDEDKIIKTLIDEYNWETASDTETTWRIGDGTAAFYNYIYYTLAGLTENDTFRSNQIRESMLSRDKALQFVEQENEPRYESMQWYCDIVGVDFYSVIERINGASKLYQK